MGGKVWSEEEERVFWTEIIPSSKKRQLYSRPSREPHGWESLRKVMQDRMGSLARRTYTALMLYEHFFQNCVLERFSPNAARFVRSYIADERLTTGHAPIQRSRTAQNSVRRGILVGDSVRLPSNRARFAELRLAASADTVTQPFRQHRSAYYDTGSAHQRTTTLSGLGYTATKTANGGTNDGADAADAAGVGRFDIGLAAAPRDTSAALTLPALSSLGLPGHFAQDPLVFTMPSLSAIMSLPLLQPPAFSSMPPPTHSTEPLRLTHVPLPDNIQEMQRQGGPKPLPAQSYVDGLLFPQQRKDQRQDRQQDQGRQELSLEPSVTRSAMADVGPVGGGLLSVRDLLLPVSAPMQVAMSSEPRSTSPTITPSAMDEQLSAANDWQSAIDEIKEDEEADSMFVSQWPQE
ncbi:hypothetical protein SPBR_07234 [Sporothrix brasiliensis 5110]|uniref:Uncharacterized protein n=1 Tax=Sporothrix brasiliensis 5110 TaxID=1398154 RepID=A0A0C2INF8_9PEZI|nr:uncharacterized protein SPBR_07234 [Sporothrix brasiliensis 5110]KIH88525.1 hypothetical protein SPBR_07234 [Sporothrix brasiliensis 5110]